MILSVLFTFISHISFFLIILKATINTSISNLQDLSRPLSIPDSCHLFLAPCYPANKVSTTSSNLVIYPTENAPFLLWFYLCQKVRTFSSLIITYPTDFALLSLSFLSILYSKDFFMYPCYLSCIVYTSSILVICHMQYTLLPLYLVSILQNTHLFSSPFYLSYRFRTSSSHLFTCPIVQALLHLSFFCPREYALILYITQFFITPFFIYHTYYAIIHLSFLSILRSTLFISPLYLSYEVHTSSFLLVRYHIQYVLLPFVLLSIIHSMHFF